MDSSTSDTTRIVYGKSAIVGQYRRERAFGESAVADFAPRRCAQKFGFAGRERREVVMKHEFLETLAEQRVDLLLVRRSAERDGRERLGLAAGEDRGAVHSREHLHLGAELANVGRFAIVDTLVVVEDRHAHARAHEVVAGVDNFFRALGKLLGELGHDLVADRVHRRGALFLVLGGERFLDAVADALFDRLEQRRVAFLAANSRLGLPARRCSSCCIANIGCIASCAANSASRSTSSSTICAPPSSIMIESGLAATTSDTSLPSSRCESD